MRRFVIALAAIAALAMPAVVSAQTINTEGLSEAQIIELQAKAADARAGTPAASAQKISQYVEIGKGIGQGLGTAAREMNIAVNDFAKTPVGQVTMALIVFKVAGGKLIGVFGGLLWYSVMIPLWVVFFNKMCFAKRVVIKYHENGKQASKEVIPTDPSDDHIAAYRFFMFLVLAFISVAGFFMLFG